MTADGRAAAKAVHDAVDDVVRGMHVARVLHGTVTSLGWASSPPTVTFTEPVPTGVTAQGRPNIRFLAPYQPTVGDVVVAMAVGDDIWITGQLSNDTGPITVAATGAGTTAQPIEFGSTYTNYGGGHQSAQYRIVGNEVIWSGVVAQASGTPNSSQIIQAHGTTLLPASLRPQGSRIFNARAYYNAIDQSVRVELSAAGALQVLEASPNSIITWLSLDGIRYYLDQ